MLRPFVSRLGGRGRWRGGCEYVGMMMLDGGTRNEGIMIPKAEMEINDGMG